MNYRQVSQVYSAPPKHWVGNGFCVHSMFDYTQTHKNTDPFLLMDYASPSTLLPMKRLFCVAWANTLIVALRR